MHGARAILSAAFATGFSVCLECCLWSIQNVGASASLTLHDPMCFCDFIHLFLRFALFFCFTSCICFVLMYVCFVLFFVSFHFCALPLSFIFIYYCFCYVLFGGRSTDGWSTDGTGVIIKRFN